MTTEEVAAYDQGFLAGVATARSTEVPKHGKGGVLELQDEAITALVCRIRSLRWALIIMDAVLTGFAVLSLVLWVAR
jgi:hypothetical protein